LSSSRILKIIHRTRYEYVAPVLESQNAGHFLPAIFQDQVLLEQKVSIIPEPVEISTHKNYFGNLITLFRCDQPHIIFEAVSELKIEKRPILEFTSGPTVKEAMDIFKNKAETLPKVCWAYLPNTSYS
jgi:transglutaminase-like putative cysteine protease